MALNPSLLALQKRLDRMGVTAVEGPDYLEIRLALFTTLRVRNENQRLTIQPFLGAVERGKATIVSTVVVAVGILGLFMIGGATPLNFGFAFLGVLSRVYECMRYVVSETSTSKIQMLWDNHDGFGVVDASHRDHDLAEEERARELGAGIGAPARARAKSFEVER